MIKKYITNINTNKLVETDSYEKGTWISLVAPTEEEIKEVCENVQIVAWI